MYITTMEKIKERNFIIQELMGILKDRMVFANDLSLEVPNDIDDLPGIDILDVGEKYHWHKRKVLDKLEDIISSAWKWHSTHPNGYEN